MYTKVTIDAPTACVAVIRNSNHDSSRYLNTGSRVSNYYAFCHLLAQFIEDYGLPTDYRLTLMHNGDNLVQGASKRLQNEVH